MVIHTLTQTHLTCSAPSRNIFLKNSSDFPFQRKNGFTLHNKKNLNIFICISLMGLVCSGAIIMILKCSNLEMYNLGRYHTSVNKLPFTLSNKPNLIAKTVSRYLHMMSIIPEQTNPFPSYPFKQVHLYELDELSSHVACLSHIAQAWISVKEMITIFYWFSYFHFKPAEHQITFKI